MSNEDSFGNGPNRPWLYLCAPARTATDAERDLIKRARIDAFVLGWIPVWGPCLTEGFSLSDDNPTSRKDALAFDHELMRRCDALLVVGERITEGMRGELVAWQETHKTVLYALCKAGAQWSGTRPRAVLS